MIRKILEFIVASALVAIVVLAASNYHSMVYGNTSENTVDPTALYREVISVCGQEANGAETMHGDECRALIDKVQQDKHVTVYARQDVNGVWVHWIEYS